MKRFGPTLLVLGIAIIGASIVVASGSQGIVQTSSAVQIPEALVIAFNGLVFALVTAGLLWLFNTIGIDLTGIAQAVAASLSAFLLAAAQHWIDLAPVEYDPWITMFLNILLVVLTGLGAFFIAQGKHKSLIEE